MVDIPIQWVTSSIAGMRAQEFYFLDLYEAFDRGENGSAVQRAAHLPPAEIARVREMYRLPLGNDPLPAALSATGRYELLDGHHRAARHVHVGHKTIPVTVAQVSPLWGSMVDQVQALYPDRGQTLYQGIEHPFFDAWTRLRNDARLQAVKAAAQQGTDRWVPGVLRTFLDLGSCTGRLCRDMARAGWFVFGVDQDPRVVRIAEWLNLVFRTEVHYECHARLLDLVDTGNGWGAIACLSLLHHLPQVAATHLVQRCLARAQVLVVDSTSPEEPRPWADYDGWLREAVASADARAEEVGVFEGRKLYRCTRGVA